MGTSTLATSAETARLAVEVASDKQASEIVMLDLRGVSDFTDYFVILTAESPRQIENLATEIETALKMQGAPRHHREGSGQGGWILLDFSNIVVHLFHSAQREFYDLEGAWPRGTEIVRVQ